MDTGAATAYPSSEARGTDASAPAGVSRRGLQRALGAVWMLDGVLQLQPFIFTRGFADQIIGSAGQGQPRLIAAPIGWAAHLIAAQPAAWNWTFALIQLGLGIGLFLADHRAARVALAASIAWALAVWYLGEGLGGLAGGDASLQAGAPGAALLYAVLAVGAWPGRRRMLWLRAAWAVVWCGGGLLGLLAGHSGGPGLAALEVAVGLGALWRPTAVPALALGIATAAGFWVFGQSLGQLTSGQATDPNTGPLLVLMALAVISTWHGDWTSALRRVPPPARVV